MLRYRALNYLYRVLPVVCGCHCRDDRSFHTHGIRHPVCARCEGMLVGWIMAAITGWFWHPPLWCLALCLAPLLVDGSRQQKTAYESNNMRRLVTGILFGYGLLLVIVLSLKAAFLWGYGIGSRL